MKQRKYYKMEESISIDFVRALGVLVRKQYFNLWDTHFCKLSLLREHEMKIKYLDKEIESVIDRILIISKEIHIRFIFYNSISAGMNSCVLDLVNHISDGCFFKPSELKLYHDFVETIDCGVVIIPKSLEAKNERWEFEVKRREAEIKVLPKMDAVLETWANFQYLDCLYQNKEDVLGNRPVSGFVDEKSMTRKIINYHFDAMDKNKGWKYAFNSEVNYNAFCDLLTQFFEYKQYILPNKTISLKNGSKTRVASALGDIYQELIGEGMRTNEQFYALVRSLEPFKEADSISIYNLLKC